MRHIKIQEAALYCGVTPQTIRNWSRVAENSDDSGYGKYLSASAVPPKGEHRQFVEDDIRVFLLIKRMSDDKKTTADILAALEAGEIAGQRYESYVNIYNSLRRGATWHNYD